MSFSRTAGGILSLGSSLHVVRLLAIASVALMAAAASAASMPSRPVAAQIDVKSKPALLGSPHDTPAFRAALPRVTDSEWAAGDKSSKRPKFHQVGIGRDLPAAQRKIGYESLAWITAGSGVRYTTLEFESTGATAIRLSIDPQSLPKGVSLYVYGTWMPELIYGPFTHQDVRAAGNDPFWLPVIEGSVARVELRATASANLYGKALRVPKVSHLTKSVRGNALKDLDDIGTSGACNIDIACPPSSASWVSVGSSVAKYVLTTPGGRSGTCTGTLINSGEVTPRYYFLTAHHCIGSVAEASSIHTYWFFERATCGGANPTSVTDRIGGATFINAVVANDMTLVRLNDTPPVGALLAGWNSSPLASGNTVVALHHPHGDLKKFSAGSSAGFTQYLNNTVSLGGDHIRVLWASGTTEAGSSGSALFNTNGQIVGTLHGGDASCGTPSAPDWYGRFDQAYVSLQPWLAPGAGGPPPPQPPPSIPSTQLTSGVAVNSSIAEGEERWYRITTASTATNLTVTLTNMNADGDLYVFRDNQGAADPDCESEAYGNVNETCSFANPGAATWYIAVVGFESTNFRLTAVVTDPSSGGGGGGAPGRDGGSSGGGGGLIELWMLALLGFVWLWRIERRRARPIVSRIP